MKRMILTITAVIFLLIVGTIIFIFKDDSGFLKSGGKNNIMTLHTGKPQSIIIDIKMGEIDKNTTVTINKKTAKEGDNINLGDEIKVQWD